jgi:hypothetical protein
MRPHDCDARRTPCFNDATIGYGIGSEKTYKACML